MKITKQQLKQIIKEELEAVLSEEETWSAEQDSIERDSGKTFEDLGIKVDIPGIDLGND